MTSVLHPAPTEAVRGARLLSVVMALFCTAVALWATAPYLVGVFHDDGVYALLARSIAAGEGFHYSHLPGAPAATHYPPLYPLLLGAVWWIWPTFPDNLPVLLALNAVLVGVAAYGWQSFAREHLGWRADAAAAGAVAATLTVPVLALSSALLSESLFLALLWPALICAERTAAMSAGNRPDSSTPGAHQAWSLATGALVGVVMLARTHALALLLALVLIMLVRRRWVSAACVVAGAVLVMLPWQLWASLATPQVVAPLEGAYGSYLGWFVTGLRDGGLPFVIATMRTNLGECWLLLQDRIAPGAPSIAQPFITMLAAFALLGGAWSVAGRAPVTLLFVVAYLGIVLIWPYAPWRFAWAVWPLLMLLAFQGIRAGWQAGGRARPVLMAAAAILAWSAALTELSAYRTRSWHEPARRAAAGIAPVVEWVRRSTLPGDVVLAEGEQIIALFTGRRAAPPVAFTALEYVEPQSPLTTATALREMIAAVPARYLLTLTPSVQQAARALGGTAGVAEIGAAPPALVFGITRQSGPHPR